ncbi:E3 ubiquitin-protein ligase WAV3-like [Apium graveolens]|uniref:E3 ubiquitin-protein ligase WAV3-like n=1 Tax=Apium graveolens TaxID=4045 RepID=UPI003D79A56D
MVLGWRRAFCTSIPRDPESKNKNQQDQQHKQSHNSTPISTPKIGTKFTGFFSNPSTPRLQTQPVSSSGLRCRTSASTPVSAPGSPKLQCKTAKNSPIFHRSNPSSPKSPSTFSLLRSTLRLSKTRCGICLQSVKTGQGMAIFTAECSHPFHFPCIASHVKKQNQLICPVCNSTWKELPLLSIHPSNQRSSSLVDEKKREVVSRNDAKSDYNNTQRKQYMRPDLKVYNDDEPLMSPTSVARFNPIPELDENEDEDSESNNCQEFQGFFVNGGTSPVVSNYRNVDVRLLPEAAVVSIGRSYETYAIIIKVKAPQASDKAVRRVPIDLVTVLDVGASMTAEKMLMTKRAMRSVVSSLSSADRLSIVAFSGTSKRLLPLRRMTSNGKRSARRIIDALAVLDGVSSANDALKKAVKVLEDRRERNTTCSVMVLSDGCDDRERFPGNHIRQSSFVFSTRYTQQNIPVHSIGFNQDARGNSPESFAKCVGGLLSVVVQDLKLQLGFVSGSAPAEIAAVYSFTARPASLGSGCVTIGDCYPEEERELLVELKVPSSATGAHHVLSVRCCFRDPSTHETVYGKEQALLVPRPHAVRSSTPSIQRLRNLFLSTRAIAESRRLVERNDLTGAQHMLGSAKALLLQSSSAEAEEFIRGLEIELAEVNRRRQNQNQRSPTIVKGREFAFVDEKGEPLTPTSAWRAAEKLAKVAIMRKSVNRVSDLHGFEDARF